MSSNIRTAAALGLFDGVHLGHRAVLAAAAKQTHLIPAAFTFQPELTSVKGAAGFLYPASVKAQILREECGMKEIFAPDFGEIAGLSGEAFVRDILCGKMQAAKAVCGRDFRFGREASCDVRDLVKYGIRYGIEVEIVEDVTECGEKIASSRIRELLQSGKLVQANALLGAPYRMTAQVVRGASLGHTIGFATINQYFAQGQLVPHFGVYASETLTPDGWYASVTNIGRKPTVDYGGQPLAETHILDFSGNLYGQELTVMLTDFLRDEQKFSSLDALKEQLHADTAQRRQLSGNYHRLNT